MMPIEKPRVYASNLNRKSYIRPIQRILMMAAAALAVGGLWGIKDLKIEGEIQQKPLDTRRGQLNPNNTESVKGVLTQTRSLTSQDQDGLLYFSEVYPKTLEKNKPKPFLNGTIIMTYERKRRKILLHNVTYKGGVYSGTFFKRNEKIAIKNGKLTIPNSLGQTVETYKNGKKVSAITFNLQGKATRAITFNSNNEIEEIEENSYNPSGNITQSIKYGSNREIKEGVECKYNENNQLLELRKYASTRKITLEHIINEYNENRLVRTTLYGERRKLVGYTENEYNAHGDLTDSTKYGSKKEMLERIKNKYDENNNLVEHTKYGQGGKILEHEKKAYDSHNNVVQHILFDENGNLISKTKYLYKGKQLLESKTWNTTGQILSHQKIILDGEVKVGHIEYVYNHKNLLIEESKFNSGGEKLELITYGYINKRRQELSHTTYTLK